jgi:hypothetical protein
MKKILQERNLVVILFVLVLIMFSFAQRDTQKVKGAYTAKSTGATEKLALTSTQAGQNAGTLK